MLPSGVSGHGKGVCRCEYAMQRPLPRRRVSSAEKGSGFRFDELIHLNHATGVSLADIWRGSRDRPFGLLSPG